MFRESEVVARQGQSWFVLFERDNNYELALAKARVKKLKTYSWGDERDVELTFDKPGSPIFAFRNFKKVRSGEITSLFHRPSFSELDRRGFDVGSMKDGYKQEFFLEGRNHVLRVSNGLSKGGKELAVLVLESGDNKQVVFSDYKNEPDFELGNLLWVGDIDRDGELDFVIEPYSEKGGYSAFLFISSEAATGDFVKFAAAFGLAGC